MVSYIKYNNLDNEQKIKLDSIKDNFINLIDKSKKKDSDLFNKYKDYTFLELLEEFSNKKDMYINNKNIVVSLLLKELEIDPNTISKSIITREPEEEIFLTIIRYIDCFILILEMFN